MKTTYMWLSANCYCDDDWMLYVCELLSEDVEKEMLLMKWQMSFSGQPPYISIPDQIEASGLRNVMD